MTSVKIKFRPSMVEGKEEGIYFQIIHNRIVRQLNTDYKVFVCEWDAETESFVVSGSRSAILCGIKERDGHSDILQKVLTLRIFTMKSRHFLPS